MIGLNKPVEKHTDSEASQGSRRGHSGAVTPRSTVWRPEAFGSRGRHRCHSGFRKPSCGRVCVCVRARMKTVGKIRRDTCDTPQVQARQARSRPGRGSRHRCDPAVTPPRGAVTPPLQVVA